METFGKSGCRRIVPGQYLAVDPKGRAIMVGKWQNGSFENGSYPPFKLTPPLFSKGNAMLLWITMFSVMVLGAVEKQKLVYIMNRDAAARLTISSPLEAHKSHTLVFGIVGIDVGFENPMFACLELDYEVSFETIKSKRFIIILTWCYLIGYFILFWRFWTDLVSDGFWCFYNK